MGEVQNRSIMRVPLAVLAALALLMTVAGPVTAGDDALEPWQEEIGAPPGGDQPDDDISQRVIGGQVTETPPWMVIGFCGGALIAPQWVLSAHHCGDRTGQTYTIGEAETRTVAQYIPFSPNDFELESPDLALWKLDRPSSQQPIPVSRDTSDDDIGDLVYGIGYGNVALDDEGDGQLRTTGWTRVDIEPGGSLSWAFEYGDPGLTTCFGDSGGPVIGDANPPNADLVLVGITSYTKADPRGDCAEWAGAAKVADQVGWIDQQIAANGGPGVPVELGDIDCDGEATLADALMLAQYNAGVRMGASCPLGGPEALADVRSADLSGDGLVNEADVLALLRCGTGAADPVCN